ncbi:hypothetical protein [Clostridium butyricum]|uniref:Uncharacterized protein n=1 Tax=Clostridium butyricum E4 str. BoNT E BL5262 TaxID=632245 RepID=C4IEU0_CLOBU|nr:hypothetical protein [Clostridium butyricum]EDT74372.1 hypothetical protein CBY_2979 [Clostridium butyricum 5521]EEP55733.1 hypothetical protein CLP_3916 [Clostridium butyricum E4 str. BoNT E BL5262]NFL29700.1 hypothetical protein [Clostridium butyricum]NFS16795.1 hypothetical protein [Clostridium butyricum]
MEMDFIKSTNSYIDILSNQVSNQKFTINCKYNYRLEKLCDEYDIKQKYKSLKKCILDEIEFICSSFKGESFLVALFTMRGVSKIKMYKENLETGSLWFKIFNLLFFSMNKILDNSTYIQNNDSAQECIERLLELSYHYWSNLAYYNKAINNIDDDSYEEYLNKLYEVTHLPTDMHQRKVYKEDIISYLKNQEKNIEKLRSTNLNKIEDKYCSKFRTKIDNSLQISINFLNNSNPIDDIIIIEKEKFFSNLNFDKRFIDFTKTFSNNTCKSPDDNESELIFSYISKKYVFISKEIMLRTQEIIEQFLVSGQYSNLLNYYFKLNNLIENQKKYTTLMTYKIADTLLLDEYTLPMENKRFNGKVHMIPMIEIKKYYANYTDKDGDIDVLFLSNRTKTLYNLEYKNYEMLITRENDFTAELRKVMKDDDPILKTLARENIIKENLSHILNTYFKIEENDFKVKSIILTTKPNYYFYKNKQKELEYMEWNEFIKRVRLHKF